MQVPTPPFTPTTKPQPAAFTPTHLAALKSADHIRVRRSFKSWECLAALQNTLSSTLTGKQHFNSPNGAPTKELLHRPAVGQQAHVLRNVRTQADTCKTLHALQVSPTHPTESHPSFSLPSSVSYNSSQDQKGAELASVAWCAVPAAPAGCDKYPHPSPEAPFLTASNQTSVTEVAFIHVNAVTPGHFTELQNRPVRQLEMGTSNWTEQPPNPDLPHQRSLSDRATREQQSLPTAGSDCYEGGNFTKQVCKETVTFYARTKPVSQFIKYLNCGEDTPGVLDDRKKRASFLP
ncbi:hypothetical protein Anapl_03545 [Anas platyrhynchos]|uniref:Uncharacterized protein n=1 Tax=Anas platyrhynchos TaxID=8839 RepID=R0K688_ANAPL|nr:hypothetical protein Anapl_03545 [Anas platyrhynchos]